MPLMLKPSNQQKQEGTNGKLRKNNFTSLPKSRVTTAVPLRQMKQLQDMVVMELTVTMELTGRIQLAATFTETLYLAAGGVTERNAT